MPGAKDGLFDDRTVAEAPSADTGAEGAAQVVQSYFALVERHRYGEAWRLWSDGGQASRMSEAQFAAGFARYVEYHAQVGAPGRIEGAAGSLYVDVPITLHGRLTGGQPVDLVGAVTLRRVNDVPGATAAQRGWHIARIELRAPQPDAG